MTRPRLLLLAVTILAVVGLSAGAPGRAATYRQVAMPLAGVDHPIAVAVGADGSLYIAGKDRVVRPAGGAVSALPFDTHEMAVQAVAVDSRGTVYITGLTSRPQCQANPLAQKLMAGSTDPTALSVDYVHGVAVDAADNFYLAYGNRVHRLPPDSTGPGEDIAVHGEQRFLSGVAVDGDGVVYVADRGQRVGDELKRPAQVIKLASGADRQTVLPLTGLGASVALAADSDGNVYVADTDHGRVLKFTAGQADPVKLPFTGLDHPTGVAVGVDGSVYVADAHRVVALTVE